MSESAGTRIGFVVPAGYWLGGKNYLRNLFEAIRTLPKNPLTPVIFTGKRIEAATGEFSDLEVVTDTMLDRMSAAWISRRIIAKLASRDVLLVRLLQRHNIAVLSHSVTLGWQSEVRTIGWIPDFQHVYLPEFFSSKERRHRDQEFLKICTSCDKVVVSSECARADLRSFSPENAHKAELLRFVASPVPLSGAANLPVLRKIYGFEGSYFLLPNQFWAHKNHRVVLRALQNLKQQKRKFLVLATGSSQDSRNPSFFSSLMQYAAECDVLDCFRVLGQIPFEHLAGLMRHTTAFINPSLFEGWSTSVEEAKSMGKQIVLSDIPVHREQAPPRGLFFPPEDADALAGAMVAAQEGFDSRQDTAMQDEATARFPERQRAFGEAYLRIVRETLIKPSIFHRSSG